VTHPRRDCQGPHVHAPRWEAMTGYDRHAARGRQLAPRLLRPYKSRCGPFSRPTCLRTHVLDLAPFALTVVVRFSALRIPCRHGRRGFASQPSSPMDLWDRSSCGDSRLEGLVSRGHLCVRTNACEWVAADGHARLAPPDGYVASLAHFHERGLATPPHCFLIGLLD
jgi:hypothetical protein